MRHAHHIAALGAALALGVAAPLWAQSVESDVPADAKVELKEASHFAMPDLHDFDLKQLSFERPEAFSLKLGLAALFDYTAFNQDQNSKDQVGIQNNAFQTRSNGQPIITNRGERQTLGGIVTNAYLVDGSEWGREFDDNNVVICWLIAVQTGL